MSTEKQMRAFSISFCDVDGVPINVGTNDFLDKIKVAVDGHYVQFNAESLYEFIDVLSNAYQKMVRAGLNK